MRLQIVAQTFLFDCIWVAASDFVEFIIEDQDVPHSYLVAVVTFGWIASRRAEIIEVRSGTAGMELVVADGGARPPLLPAPGGIVAFRELLGGAAFVSIVTGGEHRAGYAIEKLRRCFRTRKIRAVGDIACADEDGGCLVIFLASCGLCAYGEYKNGAQQHD